MPLFTVRSDEFDDKTIEAKDSVDAAALYGHFCQVTVESDEYYVTYDVNELGVNEIDREEKGHQLVQVRLLVRVPVGINVEDYLNDVSFDCMKDGMDIYERVVDYTAIG